MAQLPREGVPPIPPIGRDRDAEPTVNGAAPGESCRNTRGWCRGNNSSAHSLSLEGCVYLNDGRCYFHARMGAADHWMLA
jgi:hypothetical protein